MMLPFSRHLPAVGVVYDCMDELSNFKFAPPELMALRSRTARPADVVFTGGYSLYEAKRGLHRNIHPFPSSVDRAPLRPGPAATCADTRPTRPRLPRPRLGFYGVIDERMDLELLGAPSPTRGPTGPW